MNVVEAMQSDLADAHWLLEQVVDALHAETLHWLPPGTANTIAATYAHVIANEDHFVQEVLRRRPLLAESDWAGRSGINLPVPRRESDWFAWSRRVQVDLPAAQRYAAAVYAATDAYVAALAPDEFGRAPDVPLPGGQTLHWLLHNLVVQHAAVHTGEIAVLKGLQGLRGYP